MLLPGESRGPVAAPVWAPAFAGEHLSDGEANASLPPAGVAGRGEADFSERSRVHADFLARSPRTQGPAGPEPVPFPWPNQQEQVGAPWRRPMNLDLHGDEGRYFPPGPRIGRNPEPIDPVETDQVLRTRRRPDFFRVEDSTAHQRIGAAGATLLPGAKAADASQSEDRWEPRRPCPQMTWGSLVTIQLCPLETSACKSGFLPTLASSFWRTTALSKVGAGSS